MELSRRAGNAERGGSAFRTSFVRGSMDFDAVEVIQMRLPMTKTGWLSRLSGQTKAIQRMAWIPGVALFLMTTAMAVAQAPAPDTQPVAPAGYTLHESVDLGGHVVGVNGSGAMYDTMVNMHSGPRVLGESFQLRALPGTKNTLVDSLTAFSSGWGGDPYDFARMDFYKGRIYEFTGLFRRDRQYFDYDLLGNPNIPSGLSTPIGPTTAPTGSLPYSQVNQSPFLYNTVRRMTDTRLTLFPLSNLSFYAGYSQDVFEWPSLSPSGYQLASSYDLLLQEYQRNGTDSFVGGVNWKPVKDTKLTFEEMVDHFKADSFFTMDPSYLTVQEANGTKVAPLINYDSLTPYSSSNCNANSVGTTPALSAPTTPGGLPVINPACAVMSSYLRTAPTRFLYPTEIFRFQSASIRNVSMNGDIRYTSAKMNMPAYYENFQGLGKGSATAGALRSQTYTATGNAQRKVTAGDYGVQWQVTPKVSVSDQVTFSNVQQPGTTTMTSVTTVTTPTTAGSETINNATLTTTNGATGASTFEGSGSIGVPLPDFFGQKWVTNDVTGTWDGWSRATISLTYRYRKHIIAEGIPHNAALVATNTPTFTNPTTNGTVTIDEDGGVLNVALRPTAKWDVNGSAELMYADNVFTPVAPRELQHYRVHTIYRLKPWATVSAAYNDLERHNNTNNTGIAPLDGPLDHVDHSRIGSVGAQIFPNVHYGFDFNYVYSDVSATTNICYLAGSTATLPGAAPPNGAACPSTSPNRGGGYDFGPVKDFMDAPTEYSSAAISLSPVERIKSQIGYRISSVDGTRFYNDARDVAGSLVSTWQSPFGSVAWTVRKGWIWKAEYNFYRYEEGGPSGAPYCSTSVPQSSTGSVPVVGCNSPTLAGLQTGLTISPAGETAPRNFRANSVTLGMHYEF